MHRTVLSVTYSCPKCIISLDNLRIADLLHLLCDSWSMDRPRESHCRFPNHNKIKSQSSNTSSAESQRLKLLSKKNARVVIPFNLLVWPVHKMDESKNLKKINYYN